MGIIELSKGDICQADVGAIVNAANNDLLHGGGLAAAIVQAGGQKIQEQSTAVGPIQIGEAAITDGGKLKARYVIHAASMRLGGATTEENLTKAIRNSFKRVAELDISSVAFPSVGTGIGGFPIEQGALISLQAAREFINSHPKFTKVLFVLHSDEDLKAWQNVYDRLNKVDR
ncbi:macro domain-containing protein [Patescibacteria group bacterium]|nr:macro domain-containing protein [Patescibacteria group bacterium]